MPPFVDGETTENIRAKALSNYHLLKDIWDEAEPRINLQSIMNGFGVSVEPVPPDSSCNHKGLWNS